MAEAYIAQLNAAKVYKKPIVTKVGPLQAFYAAEDYHQDYLTLHPNQPYIAYNDIPKVENLKKIFTENYIEKPTLVSKPRLPTEERFASLRAQSKQSISPVVWIVRSARNDDHEGAYVRHQNIQQGRQERGRVAQGIDADAVRGAAREGDRAAVLRRI